MRNFLKIILASFICFSFANADDVTNTTVSKELLKEGLDTFGPSSLSLKDLNIAPYLKIKPRRKKNIFIAVGLSSLVPGLGHTYLGDFKTAGSLFGSSSLALTLGNLSTSNEGIQFSSEAVLLNTSFYSIYAAYRDTHLYNNDAKNIPINSFADLSLAPFNFKILKKPEVWGGFLGALSLAFVVSEVAYRNTSSVSCSLSSEGIKPIAAFPIGIGEESFFRGYIQSAFYNILPPWGAITASSLLFGAAHIPNALNLSPKDRWRYYSFSLPLITSFGAYFGFLTYKNKSLEESVAIHAWYDFALFLADALLVQSFIKEKKEFSYSFEF